MRKERKFGEMPAWAKTGPITLRNYPYRAEAYCKERSIDRKGTHPTIELGTDGWLLWQQYFLRHLGGLPVVMAMIIHDRNVNRSFTVPEEEPQWFDPTFRADPFWRLPVEVPTETAGERRYYAEDFLAFLRDPVAQDKWARERGLGKYADPPPDPVTGKHRPGTTLVDFGSSGELYGRSVGRFEQAGDKYNPWGPPPRPPQPKHRETAETVRIKFGLTMDEWNALPDAKA